MRNGSLYYNEATNRVERVVGKLNGPVLKKNLRIASGEEVDSYLEESESLKNNSRELQVSLA